MTICCLLCNRLKNYIYYIQSRRVGIALAIESRVKHMCELNESDDFFLSPASFSGGCDEGEVLNFVLFFSSSFFF